MSDDYRDLVRTTVLDPESFVRAAFSGQQPGQTLAWTRVTLRTVDVKNVRHIQFAYYDAKKCITKNYAGADIIAPLNALVALAFKNLYIATMQEEIQISIPRSGSPRIHRARVSVPAASLELTHDRQKDLLLPEGKPDPYLQAIGFMTADGRIKADRQKKFRQINEFLKMIQQTGEIEKFEKPVLDVVDYGCGNAYLTFGFYHYLNHVLGRPARMVGVDVRGDLLAKHLETARSLGWEHLAFENRTIADFVPSGPPDITLALHACDTATDEALAQGIRWESRLIISVPCCHHHLQEQIRRQGAPESLRPIFRHGILAERQGDLLTDSFRALILRIMGYQTEVLQFISPEHTAKNVMIRAIRSDAPAPAEFVAEYNKMKTYWNVTPYLETLLGEALQRRIA
jgi:SAM-dependent methyltransferase